MIPSCNILISSAAIVAVAISLLAGETQTAHQDATYAYKYASLDLHDLRICHINAAVAEYTGSKPDTTLYTLLCIAFQPSVTDVFSAKHHSDGYGRDGRAAQRKKNNQKKNDSTGACPVFFKRVPEPFEIHAALERANAQTRPSRSDKTRRGMAGGGGQNVISATEVLITMVRMVASVFTDDFSRVRYNQGLGSRKWVNECPRTMEEVERVMDWVKRGRPGRREL